MEKVWMITGASRGFGAETAKVVLAAGDDLIATARNADHLRHLGGEKNLLAADMDVGDPAQVQAAVEAGLGRFGRIDVLVNNAGFGLLGAIEEGSAAEVEHLYRTNVFGLLNVIRAVLPGMRARRSGHVINISSMGGYSAGAGWGLYCSTKFAVEAITEALYAELLPLGVHATVVEPGAFRTDFLDPSSLRRTAVRLPDYDASVGKSRDYADSRNHLQPGDPGKLAQALLRLANAPDPPLRLPLGTDALRRIADKHAQVEKEVARWRDLSASTDIEETASRSNA
jgi:NADP-dependent 3-hydroxy acid dehydrogenase YdfG